MNTEQTIKYWEGFLKECREIADRSKTACVKNMLAEQYEMTELALSALREKQEREHPQPLTMDELRERVEGPEYIGGWIKDINDDVMPAIIDTIGSEIVGVWCADLNDVYHEETYGIGWWFFDHEPKE